MCRKTLEQEASASSMTQRVLEWSTLRLSEGKPVAIATVIEASGSVPGKVGARLALTVNEMFGTVGGAGLELKVINALKEMIQQAKAGGKVTTYGLNKGAKGLEVVPLDSLCGGRVSISMEVVMPMPHILLMGGGHVAQSIAHMCQGLGWDHSVQDTREEFSSPVAFPEARERHWNSVEDFLESENSDSINRFSDILLLGHDWKEDEGRLIGLLKIIDSSTRLGVIGSKRKWNAFSKAAIDAGIDPPILDEVDCPIGLEIGAESPGEIAVAVVAAVLKRIKNNL